MKHSTLALVAAICITFFQSSAQSLKQATAQNTSTSAQHSAQSAGTPFTCDGKLYFFREDNGSNWLSYIDQYTSNNPVVADVCKLPVSGENAMGANPIDHYIYFSANPNHTLYRMDAACTLTTVCSGLVASTDKGCFDNLGRYWIVDNSNNLIAYNISTCSVAKGPFHLSAVAGADIVFSVADCHFYMGSASNIIEVDTNGVITANLSPGFGGTGNFGGFAIGSDGNLYGIPDGGTSGKLYGYNLTTHTPMGVVYTFPNGTASPCGCDMASFPCPSLQSSFTVATSKGCGTPFNMQFNNVSIGLVSSFSWDFGDGSTDTVNFNPLHSYTQPGTYTAKLLVNAFTRCLFIPPDSSTVTFQIYSSPDATISGNTTVCSGQSTSLTAAGGIGYLWSTGDTTPAITVSPLADSSYSVTVTDVNGCTASNTAGVNVNALPVVSISGNTIVCSGQLDSLTASGGVSYAWSTGDTTALTIVSPITNANYSVTATDANGCSATGASAINVNPLPSVGFAPITTSVCATDPAFLLTEGSPAGGRYSGAGISNGNLFDPATSGVGTFTLTYTYTDENGCTNSATTSITVNPTGTVTIGPVPTLCGSGSSVTLTGSPSGGTFSGPGVSGNTFNPALTGQGMFTVTYSFPNGPCLADTSASEVITVGAAPAVTVSTSSTMSCSNNIIYIGYGSQNAVLTANTSGIVSSYQWYLNGAAIPGATSASITVTSDGIYNVIITYAGGCQSDSSGGSAFTMQVVDVRCGHNMDKVTLCHVPPGNPNNPQTLCIAPSAVAAHLKNHPGDCLGVCTSAQRQAEAEMENVSESGTEFTIFPNPFSDNTVIAFTVPESGNATLELYDVKGALVSKLYDGNATGGTEYRFTVDGSNLPQGVYISVLRTVDGVMHEKMILSK